MTEKEMKNLGYQVIDSVVDHRVNMVDKKVYGTDSYDALDEKVKKEMPMKGENPSAVFQEIEHLISNNVAHLDHPRFFSFIPGPNNYYSVLAETLATGYNVFAGHWMGGAYAAMVETRTLEWLAEIMEFPEGSGGIFTSGGSMANLTAIVTAREDKLPEDHSNGVIYYSEQTHSSLSKALRVLGFKPKNMRKIQSGEHFRIDTNILMETIKEDLREGLVPFCIIGNAGTTNTGAIDDFITIAQIATENNCWFHIDAAYGGATMLSKEYKQEVQGIEKADSVTLDPHKWWFQPYEIGCLLVRDKEKLKEAFTVSAEYLDDTISCSKEINYYEHGVQLSRSFRALKLYTFFRCVGLEKVGADITKGIKNAEYIEKLLQKNDYWEVITAPSIGIISFRVKISEDEAVNDRINLQVSKNLLEDGYAMITTTKLKGHTALRMCPIHPDTTTEFLDRTFEIMCGYIAKTIQG